MTPPSAPGTARERARRELTDEIKTIARAQLAAGGGAALSLRGIAREMGMASSALFRYFPNRDALLTALIVDGYDSLADAAEAAEAAARDGSVADRWAAICHAVRDWALASPSEYALIFGSPVPGYAAPPDTVRPAGRVPLLLGTLLADLAAGGDVAGGPPERVEPPPAVRSAVAPVVALMPPGVPTGLVVGGLMAWTYLFGAVSSELFGHRHGVVEDDAAFFDHEVRRVAAALGLVEPAG